MSSLETVENPPSISARIILSLDAKEYEEKAKKDLSLEFVLRKIADSEKITVEQGDIENALKEIKDEKQKAQIMANPYLVASIIRQQKTLDFLTKL